MAITAAERAKREAESDARIAKRMAMKKKAVKKKAVKKKAVRVPMEKKPMPRTVKKKAVKKKSNMFMDRKKAIDKASGY